MIDFFRIVVFWLLAHIGPPHWPASKCLYLEWHVALLLGDVELSAHATEQPCKEQQQGDLRALEVEIKPPPVLHCSYRVLTVVLDIVGIRAEAHSPQLPCAEERFRL
jgi:hypothetical protein